MLYTWEPNTARYRDSKGRFTSPKQVKALAQELLDVSGAKGQTLADQYNSGKLRAKEFGDLLKEELKKESIRQYVLSRGGLERMTKKDWGSIGGSLSDQYKYLSGFVDDIGNLSELEVSARTQMYINSTRESFEKGKATAASESKLTKEHWVLSAGENCSDCIELASKGWVDIGELGQYPGDGQTKCKTNCGCSIEYK